MSSSSPSHPSPPPQTPNPPPLSPPSPRASTTPTQHIITTYLPLAGLVLSPLLIALPPRKLDVYTWTLVGVFGVSAREVWVQRRRGGRRGIEGAGQGGMLGDEKEGSLLAPSQDMLVMGMGTGREGEGQSDIKSGGGGAREGMVKGGWLDGLGPQVVTSDKSRSWRWLGYGHDGLVRLHGSSDVSGGLPSSSPQLSSEAEHTPTTPLMFPRQGGIKGLVRSLYSSSDSSASDTSSTPSKVDEFDIDAKRGGEYMREIGDESVKERRKRQVEQDRVRFERGDSVMDVMGRDVAEVFGRKVVDEEDEDEDD